MTREVGVGSVYVGLRRARERGNVCVCLCCREIGKERLSVCVCVCVCFSAFMLCVLVNVHSDRADPLWQGLYCKSEELC